MRLVQPQAQLILLSDPIESLQHIEKVGRVCYKSEDKITDDSYKKFIAMLIKRGHEAMLEHAGFSVLFTTDRGVTHEIVRHRVASFAQESTRYCNYSNDKFDSSVTFVSIEGPLQDMMNTGTLTEEQYSTILQEWLDACSDSEKHYFNMLDAGASPQIARSVLNNSVKADINVTMNFREWRHFFSLRADKPAHPQMRQVVLPLLYECITTFPVIFDDLSYLLDK